MCTATTEETSRVPPFSGIASRGRKARLVDASGHSIVQLLPQILKLFPIDSFVPYSGMVMDPVPDDKAKGLASVRLACLYRKTWLKFSF